jgi:hypothetical protein
VEPIKPNEVIRRKEERIPDEVIEAFNEMILDNWDGRSSTFQQKEVVDLIVKNTNLSVEIIFNKHYLDIETIFERAGWIVKYDKPAYNESYPETFKFRSPQ